MGCTDSAGDIHFLMDHVVPEGFAGFQQAFVLRCSRYIGHAGIKINGTYRMTLHLILLTHRTVCLVVTIALFALRAGQAALNVVVVRFCSALVDEVFCKIEILLLTGQIIETHQRHLCNFVTRITCFFALAVTESAGNKVRETLRCF